MDALLLKNRMESQNLNGHFLHKKPHFYLEEDENVVSYVKNDHLDFVIPYDFLGVRHPYYPDFLVRYKDVTIILEVKGYESEQDRQKRTAAERWVKAPSLYILPSSQVSWQKRTAAERWVKAVNYHGGLTHLS